MLFVTSKPCEKSNNATKIKQLFHSAKLFLKKIFVLTFKEL